MAFDRLRDERSAMPLVISGEHLSERHRQFLIIALGELILVTGRGRRVRRRLRRRAAVSA
ncbi:low temperature requirement protein A [Micromonospora sp. NPDC003776]